ncbi:hypothetical protein J2Y58_002239 [Sphingomonas sp. BE138]|nr:hypothetical protein [Sphingomonas sp. BE138]
MALRYARTPDKPAVTNGGAGAAGGGAGATTRSIHVANRRVRR